MLPFFCIDHDGSWLIGIILDNHTDNATVHLLNCDGVGGLTGPVNVPTVGVKAQVMKLVVHLLSRTANYD